MQTERPLQRLAKDKEWPMTQDVQRKVFSVHHVLAILLLLLRVVHAGSLQVILFHIHSSSAEDASEV